MAVFRNCLSVLCFSGFTVFPAFAQQAPAVPLDWAHLLLETLSPENNEYASQPSQIRWESDGLGPSYNRTMCASFLTLLIGRTYGFNENFFRRWTGSASPSASIYHDLIVNQNLFSRIDHITQMRIGDIIAIRYNDDMQASGHVAIIASTPVVRWPQSEPWVPDTIQYEVDVVDSSRSGHGPEDTRRRDDGGWNPGAGKGRMRLYIDRRGNLAGYSWSAFRTSAFVPKDHHPIVVGRLLGW